MSRELTMLLGLIGTGILIYDGAVNEFRLIRKFTRQLRAIR